MSALTLYFDPQHAVDVHDWIIEHSGGLPGLKDLGQLESVLEHIQNDDYYPTFDAKLTHLIFGIIIISVLPGIVGFIRQRLKKRG